MNPQGIVFAVAFAVINLCHTATFGQFKDAVYPQSSVGVVPVLANNTGNYILETGGVSYQVNVSDDMNGVNAMLSWKSGTATGFTAIDATTIVLDPDVCLVKNGAGSVFAIVAYFDQNANQFMMRVFSWIPATQQFSGMTPEMLSPGTYLSAVNIDANDDGDFAIVWDQPGQLVQLAFGSATGGGTPQLTFPGAAFNLEPGSSPDVCLYRNINTGYKQVDVVYISPSLEVFVDFYRHTDLIIGTIAVMPTYRSGPADLVYRNPRIACPAPGTEPESSFTVVVEDSDNLSSWYIKAFNKSSCCPGFSTIIYNDGSTGNSPYNLTDVPNTKPVVAYQGNAAELIVGWNFDNSFGLLSAPGASVGAYPVAMTVNKQAKVYPASSYLNVPTMVANGIQVGNLSVSGRFASSGLFTYLNNTNDDIYYKSVPHVTNAGNLKLSQSNNFNEWLHDLNASNLQTGIIFYVYDVVGRQVFYFDDAADKLYSKWNAFQENAPDGIYTARSYNLAGDANFTGKLYVGN